MTKNRISEEFSKCCKSAVFRTPKTEGFEPYCDKCGEKCEITLLKAKILVDIRKNQSFNVTKMYPQRKIINVLIDTEGKESFEISYLEHECELFIPNKVKA